MPVTYTLLVLVLMFLGLEANMATAKTIDLLGRWDGTAEIATGAGFDRISARLDVLAQQGRTFSGTMLFGDGDVPFNVNGVVDEKFVRITGSASTFEADISGQVNRTIHGTCSRFETPAFPSATLVFDLNNKEFTCVHSGGTVGTKLCCASVGDFQNTCSIGGCGCSPASSHQVTVCDCGPKRCFDGTKCVSNSR